LLENWPTCPDRHSSPPLHLVVRRWPYDGGLPTRFRTEPYNITPNIKCAITLELPLTLTTLAPKSSLRRPLTLSTALNSL